MFTKLLDKTKDADDGESPAPANGLGGLYQHATYFFCFGFHL
jgi:hypothetical protein